MRNQILEMQKLAAEARDAFDHEYMNAIHYMPKLAEALERALDALEVCKMRRNQHADIGGTQSLLEMQNAELECILKGCDDGEK